MGNNVQELKMSTINLINKSASCLQARFAANSYIGGITLFGCCELSAGVGAHSDCRLKILISLSD